MRKSFVWSFYMQFGNHILSIFTTVLLARLLEPSIFGTITIALVIADFSNTFLNFGFGQALIQKKDVSQSDLSSVFWLNILFGTFILIIVCLIAPYVSTYFRTAQLTEIIRVLSVSYLISAAGIVPQILLTRALDFKSLAKVRLPAVLIASIGGIIIAYIYQTIWAIVFIEIVRTTLIAVFSLIVTKWRPKLSFDKKAVRSLSKFSINIFGNETMTYWLENLDKIIIGKLLGDNILGLYKQSYSFMLLPVNNLARVVNMVLFPLLSREHSNEENKKNLYSSTLLKVFSMISVVLFPSMTILFITASSLTKTILGDNWLQMVPMLQTLAIVGIFYTLAELTYSFFLSSGNSGSLFLSNTISRSLTLSGIFLGSINGMDGLLISLLITSPMRLIILFIQLYKISNFPIYKIIKLLLHHVVFSISVGLITTITCNQSLLQANSIVQLIVAITLTLFIYLAFLRYFLAKEFNEFKFLLLNRTLF